MPTPTPPPNTVSLRARRRREDLSRRREDTIAGAMAIFAEKGFHETQMSEIAAAAEVSRKTLYAMFESKDQLYQDVITAMATTIRESVEQSANELADPGDQFLSIIDSLFRCYEENQDFLKIYARGTHGLPSKIREAMGESSMQTFQSFTGWVIDVAKRAKAEGFLQGLDAETAGISLVGTVTTTAERWIELTPEHPMSLQSKQVRAVFERLLGSKGGT